MFQKRIKNSGFEIVYEIVYYWFPFSRSSNHFLVPFFVKLEKLMCLQRLPV